MNDKDTQLLNEQEKPKTGRIYDEPKNRDVYWCVNERGNIESYSWHGDGIDKYLFSIGNCFYDRASAKEYRNRLYAEFELERLAHKAWEDAGTVPDWSDANQAKFYLEHDPSDNKWTVGASFHFKIVGVTYFPSRESALKAIEEMEKDERWLR